MTSRDGSDNSGKDDCDGNNNIGGLLGRILDWEGDVVTERRMDSLVVFLPLPDARCKEDGRQTVIFLYIHYVQKTTSFQSDVQNTTSYRLLQMVEYFFCTSVMFKILL